MNRGIDRDDTPKRGSVLAETSDESASLTTSAVPLSVNVSSGKGRSTLHGDSYQLRLGLVILLRAFKVFQEDCKFDFVIAMEDPAGKDFDDVMYHFASPRLSSSGSVCVQAKHKRSDKGQHSILKENMLLEPANSVNNSFSIPRYFLSFLEVDQNLQTHTHTYVLCTNAMFYSRLVEPLMVKRADVNDELQFCHDIGASCYQINPKVAHKYLDRKLIRSCTPQLGKLLAEDVFNGTEITFERPLYNAFATLINECVKPAVPGGIDTSSRSFMFSEKFLNPTTSSPIESLRTEFDTAYRKLAKDKRLDIARVLSEVLVKIDRKSMSTVLLAGNVLDRKLKMFYDSFVLVCNSLNEEELYRKASELLPKWCNSSAAIDKLHLMLFDAMKSEKPVRIDVGFVQQMFRAIDMNAAMAQLKYSSKQYIEQLRLSFPHIVLDPKRLSSSTLAEFLQNDDDCGLYKFNCSLDSNLCSLVVAQTLLLFQNEALFLDSTNCREAQNLNDVLHDMLSYLKDVNHPAIKLIMILAKPNCSSIEDPKVLSKKYQQKIIVIEATSDNLETNNPNEKYFVEDLAHDASRELFKAHEHTPMFGTIAPLSGIVYKSDELRRLLEVLEQLSVVSSDYNVNDRNYDKIKHWYIQRNAIPLGSKAEKEHVAQHISQTRNALPYSKQDGVAFAEMARYVDSHNASTISEVERVLEMHEENVDPSGVQEWGRGKICIFLNDAGHGKSSFFTWLAWRLAKQNNALLVIKLNAMEYSTDFHQLEAIGVQNLDDTDLVRVLYRLVHLALFAPSLYRQSDEETDLQRKEADRCAKLLTVSNGRIVLDEIETKLLPAIQLIELRLFREKFNEQQLILMLDGFDEIAPCYKIVVMSCFERFARLEGVQRMYLSSRPSDFENTEFKKVFKNTLSNCSMKQLKPFARGDIILSLHKFLLHNIEDYRLCEKAQTIHVLTVLYIVISKALGDLTSVPLLLYMAQVTLLPVIIEHINFQLHTISKRLLANAKLDTMALVEHFINRKIEILITDKLGTLMSASKTAAANAIFLAYSKDIKERHILLALCAIFDKNSRAELLSKPEQESVSEQMEKVIQGEERTGIVDGIRDGVPQFVHRMFAEYFAACWLNKNRDRFRNESIFKSQTIWTHSLEKMRDFLDRMILRESEGCKLHWTLLNKSMQGLRQVLLQVPVAVTVKDRVGRLPVHLVAKSNIFADELLKRMPCELVNEKDDLFGWNALDYAFLLNDGFAIRDLLKWGARLNVDILLQQLYSNDVENIFIYGTNYAYFLRNYGKPSDVADIRICERVVKHLIKERGLDIYSPRPKFESLSVLEFSTAWNLRDMFHQLVTQSGQPAQVLHGLVNRLFQLAFERKSHDIIDYLVQQCRFPLPQIEDNRGLLGSAKRAIDKNQYEWFKILFQQLCTRYNIVNVVESDIVDNINGESEKEVFEIEIELEDQCCVRSEKNVRLSLPEYSMVEDFDHDVDEIFVQRLLSRAISIGNVRIAGYILQKTKMTVTNRLIVTIMRLFPKLSPLCHKQSIPAYQYLLSKTRDLHSVDQEGRNLFHMTAQNGCLYMLPCLMSKGFDPRQINVQNHWNGFHYLMSCADEYSLRGRKALAFFQRLGHVDCFDTLSTTGESVFDISTTCWSWLEAQMLVQAQYSSLSCDEKVVAMINLMDGMLLKQGTERTLEFLFSSLEHSSAYGFVTDQEWHVVYSYILNQIPIV
ncbi:uncharacterized protein LOC126567438 [Anopheles maculipalpis]|uniref:uncharacterized protein LOC126567438 n=1 Tax=Anopheles maculipalpis TaxID=1496333 RepID=UPI002158D5E0|nr:uncharacterized protein LOC126567438 [Anopheles maculipalpis]